MKFVISNMDVPFDILSAIAVREGIDTPVLTKPFDKLTWCIACDISDFHKETIPTLVDEYNDMHGIIGVGDPLEIYTADNEDYYEVYQAEHDGYTIIYVESQDEDMEEDTLDEGVNRGYLYPPVSIPSPSRYSTVSTEVLYNIAELHMVSYEYTEDDRILRMRLIMAIRAHGGDASKDLEAEAKRTE